MVIRKHANLVVPAPDAKCVRYGGKVGQGHNFLILMPVVCSVAVVCSGQRW